MGNAVDHSKSYCTDNDKIYEIGEQWTSEGQCNLKICQEDGITLTQECPYIPERPPAHCHTVDEDLTKRFPHCCPRVECKDTCETTPEIIKETEKRRVWEKFEKAMITSMLDEIMPPGDGFVELSDRYYRLIGDPYGSEVTDSDA